MAKLVVITVYGLQIQRRGRENEMVKNSVMTLGILFMLNPSLAVAAEFEAMCTDSNGEGMEIVWTRTTMQTIIPDGTGSPFSLTNIDESSVTLTSDLGNQITFKEDRAIYNGEVIPHKCSLKIVSTDLAQHNDLTSEDILSRIEDLERRVMALESE